MRGFQARVSLPAEGLATLLSPAARAVIGAIEGAGGQARFVGGCVRDSILGRPFTDRDLAVTLLPHAVMDVCARAGFKVVPIGLSHGTVLVVHQGEPLELTTLRRDIRTDGRRAEVVFTDSWAEDAARRDFTMNALFCDREGRIFDTVGGLEDLQAGRVRFVGDPEARIREDVLRILRFFRFHSLYGKGDPDPDALQACRALVDLTTHLSAERIRTEMMKMLQAPNPVPVLKLMEKIGLLRVLGFPDPNLDRLAEIVSFPETTALHRLWALLPGGRAPIGRIGDILRLSNVERIRLLALEDISALPDPDDEKALCRMAYQRGREAVSDALRVRGRVVPPILKDWVSPRLPISGHDLEEACGIAPGVEMGYLLASVEAWWISRDFLPNRQACLEFIQTQLKKQTMQQKENGAEGGN